MVQITDFDESFILWRSPAALPSISLLPLPVPISLPVAVSVSLPAPVSSGIAAETRNPVTTTANTEMHMTKSAFSIKALYVPASASCENLAAPASVGAGRGKRAAVKFTGTGSSSADGFGHGIDHGKVHVQTGAGIGKSVPGYALPKGASRGRNRDVGLVSGDGDGEKVQVNSIAKSKIA
ncbi:hypothetical protein RUND412_002577 [Rhizina undulata]